MPEAIEHRKCWRSPGGLQAIGRSPGFNERKHAGSFAASEYTNSNKAGWVVFPGEQIPQSSAQVRPQERLSADWIGIYEADFQ